MTERPTTFKHWRSLWHSEAKMLGWMVANRFDGRTVRMGRDLYRQIRRVARIRKRLDVESEVRDGSYYEAMIEAIFNSNG